MGRVADQYRAAVGRDLERHQGSRLVARGLHRQRQRLAKPALEVDKHYQWLGSSGGSGLGYGAPAAAGAALANKSLGRFSVAIQGDGDMMYAPGVLWTCAHHSIPLMYVMHNNRGYHQEVMHVQRLANR